jgi:hypothetical protein
MAGARLATAFLLLGSEECTSSPRTRAAFVFLIHSFRHECLHVPSGVPSVIGLDYASRLGFAAGTNLDLVVVGEMALAGNVRE